MIHIPDKTVLPSGVVCIGWLHPDYPYPQGVVPPEFVLRLREFALQWPESLAALGWDLKRGCHACGYCGQEWRMGSFGVPAGDRVFYAPALIAHFVERHGYAPPAEFVAAVLSCPLPIAPEYVEAVKDLAAR